MILNKADWVLCFREFRDNVILDVFKSKNRLAYLKACIIDFLFYGGQICNKHDKFQCRKCRPRFLTYIPRNVLKAGWKHEEDKC